MGILIAYFIRPYFYASDIITLTLLDGEITYIFSNIRDVIIGIIALFTRLSFWGLFEDLQCNLGKLLSILTKISKFSFNNVILQNSRSLGHKYCYIFNIILGDKHILGDDLATKGVPANTTKTVGVPIYNSMDNGAPLVPAPQVPFEPDNHADVRWQSVNHVGQGFTVANAFINPYNPGNVTQFNPAESANQKILAGNIAKGLAYHNNYTGKIWMPKIQLQAKAWLDGFIRNEYPNKRVNDQLNSGPLRKKNYKNIVIDKNKLALGIT